MYLLQDMFLVHGAPSLTVLPGELSASAWAQSDKVTHKYDHNLVTCHTSDDMVDKIQSDRNGASQNGREES